jgi:hypothetical protein
MKKSCAVLALLSLAAFDCGDVQAYEVPSEASLWAQRTHPEKAGYIDGLCDAYKDVPKATTGELFCKPLTYEGVQTPRFCSARWKFSRDGRMADPSPGIRMFDEFYADKNHSDLPTWTVLTSYNDKACGENQVLSRLPHMQEKLLCLRQLTNMKMDHFPASVIAAQEAVCNSVKLGD